MAEETKAAAPAAEDPFDTAFAEFAGPPSTETPPAEGADRGDKGTDDPAKPDSNPGQDGKDPTSTAKPDGNKPPGDGKTDAADAASKSPKGDTPAKSPDADIWATATPEQKAAFEAANSRSSALEHENQSNRGRLSAFQRQVNELRAQPAAGAKAPARDGKAPLDSPDVKKLDDEYPEIAKPVRAMFEHLSNELAAAKRQLAGVSDKHREDFLEEQYGIVVDAHGDYDKIARSKEFESWYEQAPAFIKAGVERNAQAVVDGHEVAHIVKLFKAETGYKPAAETPAAGDGGDGSRKPAPEGAPRNPQAERRQRQIEAATSVSTKGTGVASGPPEDFDGAFDYFAKRKRA